MLERRPTNTIGNDIETADPWRTLPSSIKNIVVYGAHDELWEWIESILGFEGDYFTELQNIELRTEEPVRPGWKLSKLKELEGSHVQLWEKLQTSKIRVCGDV